MTITERLRHDADRIAEPASLAHTMLLAADEIERLEKLVAEKQKVLDTLYSLLIEDRLDLLEDTDG